MKLLTAEGFSFALQITSLILLVGYSASKSTNELPKINESKTGESYPSYFKIKKQQKLHGFPVFQSVLPQNLIEATNNANSI